MCLSRHTPAGSVAGLQAAHLAGTQPIRRKRKQQRPVAQVRQAVAPCRFNQAPQFHPGWPGAVWHPGRTRGATIEAARPGWLQRAAFGKPEEGPKGVRMGPDRGGVAAAPDPGTPFVRGPEYGCGFDIAASAPALAQNRRRKSSARPRQSQVVADAASGHAHRLCRCHGPPRHFGPERIHRSQGLCQAPDSCRRRLQPHPRGARTESPGPPGAGQ